MRSDARKKLAAETPATELTDDERVEIAAAEGNLFATYLAVERILAARTKPAPSGDERAVLAEVLYRARTRHRGPLHTTTPEWDWAEEVLAAGFRRTVSPAPSGAEAALDELAASLDLLIYRRPQTCFRSEAEGHTYHGFTEGLRHALGMVREHRAALAPSAGPDATEGALRVATDTATEGK